MSLLPARMKKTIDEGVRVPTAFYPLKICGDYSRRSSAAYSTVLSERWKKFELVIITCKNEEDIATVVTTLKINFQTLNDS